MDRRKGIDTKLHYGSQEGERPSKPSNEVLQTESEDRLAGAAVHISPNDYHVLVVEGDEAVVDQSQWHRGEAVEG